MAASHFLGTFDVCVHGSFGIPGRSSGRSATCPQVPVMHQAMSSAESVFLLPENRCFGRVPSVPLAPRCDAPLRAPPSISSFSVRLSPDWLVIRRALRSRREEGCLFGTTARASRRSSSSCPASTITLRNILLGSRPRYRDAHARRRIVVVVQDVFMFPGRFAPTSDSATGRD